MSFRVPEQFRARNPHPSYASEPGDPFGVFVVPFGRRTLKVLASDGESGLSDGWEHVSVSLADRGGPTGSRLPTWQEMCAVKELFWMPEDCVVQYHPPASQYVDMHDVLHLWRHPSLAIPMPPSRCV